MKLPIGTKVNVFEKDGFESEEGVILKYDGDWVYVTYKNAMKAGVLKFKKPKVEINLTTRGNSLEQYEVKTPNLS